MPVALCLHGASKSVCTRHLMKSPLRLLARWLFMRDQEGGKGARRQIRGFENQWLLDMGPNGDLGKGYV